ncbi:GlsB/YeaQ/YmgE family stress response membrane protein [Amycolatopsis sp. GM8]|uniref:GlsB/YeaQ/YmgE family stress response membrane protein n=1 Tax=Amycolatopsis sp. GM8 TaxID=2896530 RepID=UPI001F032CFC|nr:GlsB/YeaQ/YmgE family stress response membrane protein [Amycolatopsis sp. GM8]
MGIISWIVLGLIAGLIAKALMPGKDPGGCIITILLGIGGAFVGGWVGKTLFHVELGRFFDLRTWGLAILGSLIILLVYRMLIGRRSRD